MERAIVALSAVLLLVVFPAVSFSETPSQRSGPTPGAQGKEMSADNFDETKARILQRMEEQIKRITQEKACVSAATNMDELRKCRTVGPQRMMQRPEGK